MKRHLPLAALLVMAFASLCFAQPQPSASPSPSPKPKPRISKAQLLKQLSATETKLWEAWKNKDEKVFQALLSDDAIDVDEGGRSTKAQTVSGISSNKCEIRSYSLDNIQMVMLDQNTALLTYKAAQDYTCDGKIQPNLVWATSIYVKRGGKWLSAFYQEVVATSR